MAAAGGSGADKRQSGAGRLHSPPVELPSSNAKDFFEEAKIGQAEEAELKRKFTKFCTRTAPEEGGEEQAFLTLDNFCSMLQYYECASAHHYESYFHAIDRTNDDRLDFPEFFLGCCAADPSTVHILNSFTGYERSQYVFDFYDSDRSGSLDFSEFARLTADCLGLPPGEDQSIKPQAMEKARELGALDATWTNPSQFVPIRFKQFYEFIQNERLRGTSRLFRFYKSIIKSRGSHHTRRAHGSSAAGGPSPSAGARESTAPAEEAAEDEVLSDQEDLEWHAHLLDMDAFFNPEEANNKPSPRHQIAGTPPYSALLAAAQPTTQRQEEVPSVAEARTLARKVLKTLCNPGYEGLAPAATAMDGEQPFNLATPGQLRSLSSAAARSLEMDEMVLSNIQPPVKVFGAIHGQILDLLSHFKWQKGPAEEGGDILYTSYVFLGDYCDRGPHSLEVLTLLLSLKVVHPNRVFLLRGIHESRHMNYHLGLRAECESRCGASEGFKVYESLNRTFEYMSLAAVLGGQLLALGAGVLPPALQRLDQLRQFTKPLSLPHATRPNNDAGMDRNAQLAQQLLLELFTPPPLLPRQLGVVREATIEQVRTFCNQHRLAAVVRSRLLPSKGFSFDCGGRMMSVTSCLNYCDAACSNDAAVLCVTTEEGSANLQVRPKVITAQVARLYSVLGRQGKSSSSSTPRWPSQIRAPTPGRSARSAAVAAASMGDAESTSCAEAAGVLVFQDNGVSPDSSVTLTVYPAYGPGRLPGSGRGHTRDRPRAMPTAELPAGLSKIATGDSADMQYTCNMEPPGSRLGGRGSTPNGASDGRWNATGGASPSGAGGAASSSHARGAPAGAPAQQQGRGGGARSPSSDAGRRSLGGASTVSAVRGSGAPTTPTGAGKAREQRGASRGPGGGASASGTTPKAAGAASPSSGPADLEALGRLLQDSAGITAAALPPSPAQFLQGPHASDQPVVRHLCQLWVEAGLSERDWAQALRTFSGELSDQPRQTGKTLGGGLDSEEHRWSLETFSMWLLKRGRRLRDCSQWFRAFDFDQDDMISVTDFLQGLVASAAPRTPDPNSAGGLCSALAVFRLLDLGKRQGMDARDLEAVFAEAQVPLSAPDPSLTVSQMAQQASDFSFFRSLLMPRLQGAAAFRLRVFGQGAEA